VNKWLSLGLLAMSVGALFPAQAGDPTRPPQFSPTPAQAEAPKARSLTLQQILVSGDKRSAVINDQLVREGDRVNGAQVVRITPDKVVVKIRQKLKTLSLIKRTKHSEKK